MADRVAIIGGSTLGRDHFPFPIADDTGVDGVSGVPLDSAMKWFWLVKKWHVEAELSLDPAGDFYIEHEFEMLPTREADLVREDMWSFEDSHIDGDVLLNFSVKPYLMQFTGADDFRFPITVFAVDSNLGIVISNYEHFGTDDTIDEATDCDSITRLAYYGPTATNDLDVGYINITPVEFWPHAYKNGDPVYDTTDGSRLEPLRDPLNG